MKVAGVLFDLLDDVAQAFYLDNPQRVNYLTDAHIQQLNEYFDLLATLAALPIAQYHELIHQNIITFYRFYVHRIASPRVERLPSRNVWCFGSSSSQSSTEFIIFY